MPRLGALQSIDRVAEVLGVDVELLEELAVEMDDADGHHTVWLEDDDSLTVLTDFGVETIANLLEEIRTQPGGTRAFLSRAGLSEQTVNRIMINEPRP